MGYAISTMMPNNNILLLKEMVDRLDIPLKVHFSMHTPIDKERFILIPGTRVSVEEALGYLEEYRNTIRSNKKIMNEYVKLHRTDDPVEIHYTLIKDVNDGKRQLAVLCDLLKNIKFL